MNKLIIFDFDGTIADSMWCWDALGKDMMIANNIPIFDDYDKVIRTMSVPHFAIYMSKYYPQLGTSENIMNKWHEKMIFNYKTKVHLKKGVVPFLEYLKSMHYTLYLASATHLKVLSKALAHFQINHYFDFIITEETIGISKRDPKIYQICMDKAGVDAKHVYIFEDANHAVATAIKLGFHVCAVEDNSMRNHKEEIKQIAELYVSDFSDIEKLKKFIG